MRPSPHGILILLENLTAHLGIVQQSQGVISSITKAIEPTLINPQPHSNRLHDLYMQLFALRKEPQHDLLKLLALVVEIRPLILEPCNPFPSNLKTLLDIRALHGPQLLNFGRVGQVGGLFPSLAHIAAVCFGGRPRQLVFLAQGPFEEERALPEGGADCAAWDPMVADVDEAGALEAG